MGQAYIRRLLPCQGAVPKRAVEGQRKRTKTGFRAL